MSSWLQTRLFTRARTASTASQPADAADAESARHAADAPSDGGSSSDAASANDTDAGSESDDDDDDDAALGAVPGDAELADIAGLFARHSVAEVRAYAQRLQRLMAREQRRMRRVAAAHYPALADAADAVVRMDALSAAASLRLSRASAMLDQAAQPASRYSAAAAAPQAPSSPAQQAGARDATYAAAAQVKVLVDTAELVWRALAARRYVHAALVFLIAREIHGRLAADGAALAAFPVVGRVWAAVAPLGAQIAERARQQLRAPGDAGAAASLSAVCSVALLDDVDAEVASAEFLAHRGAALWPLLALVEAGADEGADEAGAALGRQLCELLGHVRLILADFVVIFGVPAAQDGDADGCAYASWAATTLAGICADAELPLHPALRMLWDDDPLAAPGPLAPPPPQPPLSDRRSEMQALRARRRKSSVAGSMLTAAAIPATPTGAGAGSGDARHPQPWRSGAASSNVIVARYLPAAVARFSPPLVRLLDVQWPAAAADAALAEADEDGGDGAQAQAPRLAQCLGDARALARELAAHVQPVVARCARQSLRLWWPAAAQRVQAALARAVARRVGRVEDATRAARAVVQWEADAQAERRWARGLAWTRVVAGSALLRDVPAQGLHAALVEPLLRERARQLQRAAVEAALALADAFADGAADVCAGQLPWLRGLDDAPALAAAAAAGGDGALGALAADVRASLDFQPPGVRALRDAVDAGLARAWRDAQAWWAQLSGAQAAGEARACAEHFARQWALLAARLDARAPGPDGVDGDDDADADVDDDACERAVRGAWATVALAAVARRVLATEAAHVRACWPAAGVTAAALVDGLHAARRRLLRPWLRALARATARAWAQRFDALYYRVPAALRADARATRRDVVRAWRCADGGNAAARFAALRRLAVEPHGPPHGPLEPSAAARCLGVALRAQLQAVGGLGALAGGAGPAVAALLAAELGRAVAEAAAAPARRACAEWDAPQLAADARFVLRDQLALPEDAASACVSELMRALHAGEARTTPARALIGC
ncbi:hypothetical protein LPJ53_003055 [Coemansia erecta]|uniref:Conserved oligomeric Golgi complex subunit 1 n=1 Tax=Coemansia erecta TaxID=147472 RepID=A0A9W7Y0W9_9FUNG|nr:hypothetical protein LPJ53_003055 [Coemansia erecta]